MIARAIVSALIGQGIFWRFGYDQLGIAMNPKRQFGVGIKVADVAARRLPSNAPMAWSLKVIEIIADAGKMPLEGKAIAKHGIVPDVVAFLIPQPWWSFFETSEKLIGVMVHPERVNTPEQIRLSIGCIFGSCFRYLLAGIVITRGASLNRYLTLPIEKLLHRVLTKT